MATLEKIRRKSVLLVVIIAAALLAFILGDAITNGRNLFGNKTTVAKVGKDKIGIQEYQRKQQELSHQVEEAKRVNPQGMAQFDDQTLAQMTIDELITEQLLNKAVGSLRYRPSDEVVSYYIYESGMMMPEMSSFLGRLGAASPEMAYDVLYNPQNYNLTENQVAGFRNEWNMIQQLYRARIGQVLYLNLLQNSFKANDLDIASVRNDYAKGANVKVAKKGYDFAQIQEQKVEDADLQAAYEARKDEFKVNQPTKEVAFLAVSVVPSANDMAEATALATTVVEEMNGAGLSRDTKRSGINITRHQERIDDAEPSIKEFVSSAPEGQVTVVRNDARGFRVAKLNSRELKRDTLGNDSLVVSYELVDYTVQPSEATIEQERAKLEDYISKNNTAATFVENAEGAFYNPMYLELNPSTPAMPMGAMQGRYFPHSRDMVRWALVDAKTGDISSVHDNGDLANPVLYVVAVLDSYDEYAPVTNQRVKTILSEQVKRDKVGDSMLPKYSKATLDEAAAAMETEPVEIPSLQTAGFNNVVSDAKVKARILGSKPDGKVKVMKGDDGIYAYVVEEVVEEPVQMDDAAFANMFLNLHRVDPSSLLKGSKKVENNLYKFESKN